MNQMTPQEIGWVAGIVEGEGHIQNYRGRVQIRVKMTDEDIVRRLRDVTGVGNIYGPYRREDRKDVFEWDVGKRDDAIAVLEAMYPLLHSRRSKKIVDVLGYEPLNYIEDGWQTGWVAGILEGEGSFTNLKGKGTARITVGMTDEDVILKLKEVTEIGRISGPYQSKPTKKGTIRKPHYKWVIYKREDVAELSNKIFPMMGERRQEQIIRMCLRHGEGITVPDDVPHGTMTGYNYGCHCDRCRTAWSEYMREYRARKKAEAGEPTLSPAS